MEIIENVRLWCIFIPRLAIIKYEATNKLCLCAVLQDILLVVNVCMTAHTDSTAILFFCHICSHRLSLHLAFFVFQVFCLERMCACGRQQPAHFISLHSTDITGKVKIRVKDNLFTRGSRLRSEALGLEDGANQQVRYGDCVDMWCCAAALNEMDSCRQHPSHLIEGKLSRQWQVTSPRQICQIWGSIILRNRPDYWNLQILNTPIWQFISTLQILLGLDSRREVNIDQVLSASGLKSSKRTLLIYSVI